jgi:hypothetical protein
MSCTSSIQKDAELKESNRISRKDLFDLALRSATALIAVFGVGTYFQDRADNERLQAKNESLKVIREYSSSNILSAREEMVLFWEGQPEFHAFLRSTGRQIANSDYNQFIRRVLPENTRFSEIRRALIRFDDYFDSALYCRNSGVCDVELLDKSICGSANGYERTYGPFFNFLSNRLSSEDLGDSLRNYAKLCGNANQIKTRE